MKIDTRKVYICERCGRQYSSPATAKKCESGHYYPEEVMDYDYGEPEKPQSGGWPERVVIGGENGFGEGGTCVYIRIDLAQQLCQDDANEIPW